MLPFSWGGPSDFLLQVFHCVVSWYILATMTFEEFMSISDVGHVAFVGCCCLCRRSQWWSLLYSYCMVFLNEHRTTMIREVLVDKWRLALWKRSTCLFSDEATHRPCVERSFLCSVCSCDEHHTIIIFEGGARPSVLLDIVRFSVDHHRFVCAVWFRDEHHSTRMSRGLLHTISVDMEFSCLRRGASDDHCDTHLLPWHLQDVCSEFLFYMLAFCSVVLIV